MTDLTSLTIAELRDGIARREFMARMTAIAGSAAAAELLIAGIAASPAAAAIVAAIAPARWIARRIALT